MQIISPIRWAIRRDTHRILEIESLCFESPWTEDDLMRCLRQRNVIGQVYDAGEEIDGFVIYALHKSSIEVLSLGVHPDAQRTGIGSALVGQVKRKVTNVTRRHRVDTLICETNLNAHVFFKSQGFRCVRTRRDCYEDFDRDGYEFIYLNSFEGTQNVGTGTKTR